MLELGRNAGEEVIEGGLVSMDRGGGCRGLVNLGGG